MKSMAHTVVDRTLIYVLGLGPPTDEAWNACLDVVERSRVDWTMHLVWSDGGVPTITQRARLKAIIAGRPVPTAVVSASARVRGTVTALSWFGAPAKAFRPADLRDAIAFLKIPASRTELIMRELARLRAELAGAA
jgi:hypothetical protein